MYAATGSQTAAWALPAAVTLSLWAVGPRLARVGAGAAGAIGAAGTRVGGAGLTEWKAGEGVFAADGWVDRWFRFWKHDLPAKTQWGAPRPVLGGWWSVGRVESLVLRDPRLSIAWFDALAHEGFHIASGKLLWPLKSLSNNPRYVFWFGWIRYGEEVGAYTAGRLAVGRFHGVPYAFVEAFRGLPYDNRTSTLVWGAVFSYLGYKSYRWLSDE